MPIDCYHAFADGAAYRRPEWPAFWQGWSQSPKARAARAWRQFEKTARLGEGCRLGPTAWCVNSRGELDCIVLGKEVVCRALLRVEQFGAGQIAVGDHSYLGDDTLLSSSTGIEIGAHVMIAHGVQIFDNDSHPLEVVARRADYKAVGSEGGRGAIASAPVCIGEGAWIGFNAIILKGVTIGENSVVAAGSVVTRDVPPNCVVAGNPAAVVKNIPHVSD